MRLTGLPLLCRFSDICFCPAAVDEQNAQTLQQTQLLHSPLVEEPKPLPPVPPAEIRVTLEVEEEEPTTKYNKEADNREKKEEDESEQ